MQKLTWFKVKDFDPRLALVKTCLTLFIVYLIDTVIFSLMFGKLRAWFPQWIDPNWQSSAIITYSQSYIVGIAFIPLLFYIIDVEFITNRKLRYLNYITLMGIMIGVGLWKGDLMIKNLKYLEDVVFLGLGFAIYYALSRFNLDKNAKINAFLKNANFWWIIVASIGFLFISLGLIDYIFAVVNDNFVFGLYIELFALLPMGIGLALFGIYKMKRNRSRDPILH